MLIYLGIFFILPDKIRKNKLLGMTALGGLVIGLYSIYAAKLRRGVEAFGVGDGCGATNVQCQSQDSTKPYCLINEKDLPTSDVDQTVVFNVYGRYVRIYASQNKGDGNFSLSQVVVNDATGTNIALNKTASSSSMYPGTSSASIAVDGNLTPRSWPTITHNNNIGRATDYWQVDLGSVQMITTVRVISRADCCETINIASASNPDRVTGVRVVVLQNTTDTFDRLGVCVATPTPVYPAGTTDDEKGVIGPIILSGQNGQTALNVYRALKAGIPSSLTKYGLTDSQSAEAFLKIRVSNLAAQRKAGTIDDTSYYSQTNALKGITTMSAIPFNTSSELNTYMTANTKVKKNPVKDSFGNAQLNPDGSIMTTTVSDGGALITTGTILSVLMSKSVDNSAGYSGATVPDSNTGINGAPNSDLLAKTLLAKMPQQIVPIVIPTPTKGVIITPDMTPAQQAAAITSASNTNSGVFSGQTFDRNTSDSAAASTLNAIGYSAPKSSVTTTGQAQWYMITTNTSSLNASNACKNNGGKMATLDQIKDAQTNGASWGAWAWYADTFDTLAYPKTDKTYVSTNSSPGGSIGVNCYGPKPAKGTPGIAPWTDTAKTANGSTYIANDWSKRVSKTPLKTAEVFYVGGSSALTLDNAKWICNNLGGDLATLAQLNLAQANGAQWCSSGFLKDSATGSYPMQEVKSGCGNIGVNNSTATGATCYGIKPSMDGTTNTAAVPLQPTDTSTAMPITVKSLTVAPFSSKTNAVSWSQTSLLDAGQCVFGTTATICSGKGICVENGKTCAQATCNGGTQNNGNCDSTSSSSYSPPTCPSYTKAIICSGKIMCTPPGGDCNGATYPGGGTITTPSDISTTRFKYICEANMKIRDKLSKLQIPLTLNRASWPLQPATVFATPAIYYLPDSIFNTIPGADPTNYAICNGRTDCKLACCSGVSPAWNNVYLTGLNAQYPDNKKFGQQTRGGWAPSVSSWADLFYNKMTAIMGGQLNWGADSSTTPFDTIYTCPNLPGANCLSNDQCAICNDKTGVCSSGACYTRQKINTPTATSYTTNVYKQTAREVAMWASLSNIFTAAAAVSAFNTDPDVFSFVDVPRIDGRYVLIRPSVDTSDGYLNISQILVTDYTTGAKLSKGKTVVSTNTYDGSSPASIVTDGNEVSRSWPSIWHSASPPNRETDGIEVDLGAVYTIGSVRVYGRIDALRERSYSLRVVITMNSSITSPPPSYKCV